MLHHLTFVPHLIQKDIPSSIGVLQFGQILVFDEFVAFEVVCVGVIFAVVVLELVSPFLEL